MAVWLLLREVVDVHSPRHKLREALGDGLARGRKKVMILITLGDGPASLGEIADAHRIDRPYATAIVDQLEALGLAGRAPDPADRRRKLVALTAAGAQAAALATEIVRTPPPAFTELTPAELSQLSALLGRLLPPSAGQPGRADAVSARPAGSGAAGSIRTGVPERGEPRRRLASPPR